MPSDSQTLSTGVVSAHSLIGVPRAGLCAYNVHPRSSGATAIGVVLATPRSPIAIAISARCSTARRMEACRGEVSLPRNRSFRQTWRSAPPLRWFGPYISSIATEPGPPEGADSTCGLGSAAIVEMYGPNQRSGGALRQVWRKLRLRGSETSPLQASMRRAVEHRALMAIAIGDLGVANTTPMAVAPLERGWTLYAHSPARGTPINECAETTPVDRVWESLGILHDRQISHGDLRSREITADNGKALFGGFGSAEYGATDAQLQSDVAQLLVTTTDLYDAKSSVGAAIGVFGKDAILTASRRLSKSGVPSRIRDSLTDAGAVISAAREEVMRQTGAGQIQAEQITRFTRGQIIQLVLLGALVYVAYPFISTVPTFFSELRTANWWWALLGLAVSALTYVGAATALWACADGLVRFKNLVIMQVANTFAATTTPAGVGGLALSTRFLHKAGLGTLRATAAV